MAQLRHLGVILVATWTFLSAVDCLAVPIARNSSEINNTTQQKNNAITFPRKIVLTLTTKNETITLNLTRNLNIPSDVPLIVAENGTYTKWTPNSGQFAAYFDMNNSASIMIEMKNQSGQMIRSCRGTISINGGFYSVHPVEGNVKNESSGEFLVQIDGVGHLMRIEDVDLDFADLINSGVSKKIKQNRNQVNQRQMSFDWPSGFQRYVVEMCIFVDYALYERWYSRSRATDHWGRHSDALLNIQYYFVQVANGVDMRYSTIQESDFSINVRLVGINVATNPSDSYWTERSDVKVYHGSVGYTNMYKALELFENWLPTKMSQIGITFDQATLFTGNNLYTGFYCDGAPCSKSGLGEIGQICQLSAPRSTSVTINKDFGLYSSIQTAAHELGHNLGAQHDGYDNGCSGNDQYVMASAPGALNANNFNNAFKFSSCSLWYFRNILAQITMEGKGNCLLVGSSSPTAVAPPNFAAFPGQQYTADQQCQNIYGPSSYYCGGGSRDQTICQSMECWVSEKGACYVSTEQRAYDGTKCGNYKWCMNGKCVYDGRSPATPDTCIYGDYKGPVDVSSGSRMSCYDMGRLQPHSCYSNRTSADCCQTCVKIRDNNKPAGCTYGDKNPDLCRSRPQKSNCYESSFAESCCDSCSRVKSSRVGCEYGDRAEWCTNQDAYSCYSSENLCCETCQKFYDKKYPGCEYGDRAPWCSTTALTKELCSGNAGPTCCASCRAVLAASNPPSGPAALCPQGDQANHCSSLLPNHCYSSSSICCSTCSRFRTNLPGCEYGDKAEWCSSYVKGPTECSRPEVADLCCQSCAPHKGNGVAPQGCSDSAPWCPSIQSGQCYDSQTASTCCSTCSRHKRSNPNCLYGNRYSWCRAEYCSTNKNDCCESCS